MAVGSGVPYNVHTGNGVTTSFAYGFTVLDDADLVATVDGVPTSVTVNNVGEAAGGTVDFAVAPASGTEVLLRRLLTLTRLVEYQNNGDLLASTLNADLDRMLMLIQGVDADRSSAVRVPFPETIDELPAAASRANKLAAFDSDGNMIATAPTEGTAGALAVELASEDGAGMVGFRRTAVANAVSRTVAEFMEGQVLSVRDFGAEGDGATDDRAAILLAVRAAIQLQSLTAVQSVTVWLDDGIYLISNWLPVVSGVVYRCAARWSATVKCTGTGAAFASATHSLGVFTDNLDDIISEHEINRAGIANLYIEHTGTIAGNAGSGAAWSAAVQLVNCPHIQLLDIGLDHRTNSIDGIALKWCWRAQVIRPWVTRNNGFTGGIGIHLDSQCNNVLVEQPFVFGAWAYGIRSAGNSATLLEPNVEFATVGIHLLGVSPKVSGGYLEGNTTDIRIGTSGGSACERWKVEGTWHNGSGGSDYAIDLSFALRGEVNDPYFNGTYDISRFKSTSGAAENYANVIEITVANAASPGLAGLGLIGGRNIIRCYAEDFDDYRNYAEYRSRDGSALERQYGPIQIGTNQVVGARRTGWTAATGTATRSTFATGTVTTAQLAERVKALLDDLIAHGLIGA